MTPPTRLTALALTLAFGALTAAAALAFSPALRAEGPVRLIFDTDMGNDVDDAVALAMIHALQRRGACELLAVTITKDHPLAAAYVDAVNTFYGYPDIPIGVVRNGATPEEGRFNQVAKTLTADGEPAYPHDLASGEDAPEAVALLREILAAQPDGSVTLCQVGFFTNFARLLDSEPDDHSPLGGKELVAQKVRLLSVMAGAFQSIDHGGRFTNRHLEYNVVKDIPAAQRLAREWPTEIVWTGFEIGIATTYPHQSIEQDYDYLPHHPVKEAYYLYNPPPHDRPNWDPCALLYAVMPDRGYFGLTPPGLVVVEDDGATLFRQQGGNQPLGLHRALTLDPGQAERVREAIVQLASQPPYRP